MRHSAPVASETGPAQIENGSPLKFNAALSCWIRECSQSVPVRYASWAFTDNFNAYVEGNYGASNYEYQIGSYDQNLGSTALLIKADNAFLPDTLKGKSFTLNKYFADLPRTWIRNLNETRRAVAGLDGRIGTWN